MNVNLKVKLLNENAKLPSHNHPGDLLDLHAAEDATIPPKGRVMISLGFSASFPEGYVLFVKDRSGLAAKQGLTTMAGVIDPGYRGEYKVVLYNTTDESYDVKVGDRVAQAAILPKPDVTVEQVEELDETSRGDGGFGSSGR
ncbi:MAG: dUTP diphosphatase [Candidatus Woesearchaeota archaeon]